MIDETIIDGKAFSIIAIGYFILSFLLSSDRSDLNLYEKIAVGDERPQTCHARCHSNASIIGQRSPPPPLWLLSHTLFIIRQELAADYFPISL